MMLQVKTSLNLKTIVTVLLSMLNFLVILCKLCIRYNSKSGQICKIYKEWKKFKKICKQSSFSNLKINRKNSWPDIRFRMKTQKQLKQLN